MKLDISISSLPNTHTQAVLVHKKSTHRNIVKRKTENKSVQVASENFYLLSINNYSIYINKDFISTNHLVSCITTRCGQINNICFVLQMIQNKKHTQGDLVQIHL